MIDGADKEKIRSICDKLLTDKATPVIVVTIDSMAQYGAWRGQIIPRFKEGDYSAGTSRAWKRWTRWPVGWSCPGSRGRGGTGQPKETDAWRALTQAVGGSRHVDTTYGYECDSRLGVGGVLARSRRGPAVAASSADGRPSHTG